VWVADAGVWFHATLQVRTLARSPQARMQGQGGTASSS
jgi:hypothetical protein